MGNTQIIDTATGDILQLSPGFVPVGMKEYGGILYIASANKDGVGEIGCAPSPIITWDFQDKTYVRFDPITLADENGPRNDLQKISQRVKSGNKIFPILNIIGDGTSVTGTYKEGRVNYFVTSPIITKVEPAINTESKGPRETLKGIYDIKVYSIGDYSTQEITLSGNQYYDLDHKLATTEHWYMTPEEYANCDWNKTRRLTKNWQSYPGIPAGTLAIKAELNTIDYFRILPNSNDLYLPDNSSYSKDDLQYTKSSFKGFEFKTSSGIIVDSVDVQIYNMTENKYQDIHFGSNTYKTLSINFSTDFINIPQYKKVECIYDKDEYSMTQQLVLPTYANYDSFYIENISSNVWYKMTVTYKDQFERKLGTYNLYFNPYINDELGYDGIPTYDKVRTNQVTTVDNVVFGIPELKFELPYRQLLPLPAKQKTFEVEAIWINTTDYPYSPRYVGNIKTNGAYTFNTENISNLLKTPSATLSLRDTGTYDYVQVKNKLSVYKSNNYIQLPADSTYLGIIKNATIAKTNCNWTWDGWVSYWSNDDADLNAGPHLGLAIAESTDKIKDELGLRFFTNRVTDSSSYTPIPYYMSFEQNNWRQFASGKYQPIFSNGIGGEKKKRVSEGHIFINNGKTSIQPIFDTNSSCYLRIPDIYTYFYLWNGSKSKYSIKTPRIHLGFGATDSISEWTTLPKLSFYQKDFLCPKTSVTTSSFNVTLQFTHKVKIQDEYGNLQTIPAGINYATAGTSDYATMISTYLQGTTLELDSNYEPVNYVDYDTVESTTPPFKPSYTGDWWNTCKIKNSFTLTTSGTWVVLAYFTGTLSIKYNDTTYNLTSGIPHIIVNDKVFIVSITNNATVYRFGLFKDSGKSSNTSTDIKDHPEIILPLVESYYEDIDDNIYNFYNHNTNNVPFVAEAWQVNTLNDGTKVGYIWNNRKAKAISGGVCSVTEETIQTQGIADVTWIRPATFTPNSEIHNSEIMMA